MRLSPLLKTAVRNSAEKNVVITKQRAPYLQRALLPIHTVLFDVYGTMLLSARGEIGNNLETATDQQDAFVRYRRAVTQAITLLHPQQSVSALPLKKIVTYYFAEIRRRHKQQRANGISFPEVDIVAIWRAVFKRVHLPLFSMLRKSNKKIAQFACGFELFSNPVSLAPHVHALLLSFKQAHINMGIVSNAQFYTPILLEYLLGESLTALGFKKSLIYWSYVHGRAKPDIACFDAIIPDALRAHSNRHRTARGILYIGNDIRNDIWCAQQVGMQTCLYCGDRRSLTLRAGRYDCVTPDTWIDDYRDLARYLHMY